MPRLIDVYPYRRHHNQYEYLLLKRASQTMYAGQWRMVGGKVKEYEKAWEAALRELKEETAREPVTFWAVPSINHFYNPATDSVELIPAFAAELPADCQIKLNREHTAYQWVLNNEINRFINWPEQLRLLTLIHSILTSHKPIDDWNILF